VEKLLKHSPKKQHVLYLGGPGPLIINYFQKTMGRMRVDVQIVNNFVVDP